MICTPRGESYLKNQGAPWLGWSLGCKLNRKHQAVPFSKHDEQNGAPERRSLANWKWRISRRRPVTFDVRQKIVMPETHTDDPFDLARFVLAQDSTFDIAWCEVENGHTGIGVSGNRGQCVFILVVCG